MTTGFAVVIKVTKISARRIAHVVYDRDLNTKQVVILPGALSLGTVLEYKYDGNKTMWTLI